MPRSMMTNGDEALGARLDLQRASAAIAQLPESFREVLVLCALEDLRSEDAAAILEISPEAVRKRLSRARAELEAMLARPSVPRSHPHE